jgi:hypothetical protein
VNSLSLILQLWFVISVQSCNFQLSLYWYF